MIAQQQIYSATLAGILTIVILSMSIGVLLGIFIAS